MFRRQLNTMIIRVFLNPSTYSWYFISFSSVSQDRRMTLSLRLVPAPRRGCQGHFETKLFPALGLRDEFAGRAL